MVQERELECVEIQEGLAALTATTVNDEAKISFLTAWTERGEIARELAACVEALLPTAAPLEFRGQWQGEPLFDCCGTGGGGLNLLNISTAVMFVLGAVGIPVVKHGNRGLTKKSGSADLLEALGLRINFTSSEIPACLEQVGCVFLFAPSCFPSLAAVASARRQLAAQGRRSIFNLLGPLLNPARPDSRLIGVFQEKHLSLYREALEIMGCARFTIAWGRDGKSGRPLGEISALGPTRVNSTLRLSSGDFLGLDWKHPPADLGALLVADAAESARRTVALLRGEEKGLGREMLRLNSAVGAWTQGKAKSLDEGLALADEALDSGRALACLERWQKLFPA